MSLEKVEQELLLLIQQNQQLNIISPSGSVDSFASGNNLSLNWTTSDTHLDVCWFNYNSVNTTVNCLAGNYSFTPVRRKTIFNLLCK